MIKIKFALISLFFLFFASSSYPQQGWQPAFEEDWSNWRFYELPWWKWRGSIYESSFHSDFLRWLCRWRRLDCNNQRRNRKRTQWRRGAKLCFILSEWDGLVYIWKPRLMMKGETVFKRQVIYTTDGWMWVSNYNWGWACYHYGRWWKSQLYGWVWMPGYVGLHHGWRGVFRKIMSDGLL